MAEGRASEGAPLEESASGAKATQAEAAKADAELARGWAQAASGPPPGQSGSRIRAVRVVSRQPPAAPIERQTYASAALLTGKERPVRVLARRLAHARTQFDVVWLQRCSQMPELALEDADYGEPIQRATAFLLSSLGNAQFELAELHCAELFVDLRELCVAMASVLRIIEAFELAALQVAQDADSELAVRELGRFLTHVAVDVFANRNEGSITDSRVQVCATSEPSGEQADARPRATGELGLIGESPGIRALRAQIRDIANAPGSVLITGQSGTGKELVARAIHESAGARQRPFLPVNCAALPRELIESELFGHERGAFTGSRTSAPGMLRAAGDGTLFLDEITEMPESLQPKLLRALEQRSVRPVGGLREVPIRARIIAATNGDPEHAVATGRMRADLFYRLCVHCVEVPALHERRGDIPLLIRHFVSELAKQGHTVPREFAPETLRRLEDYGWPGNVRELRNVVEHCCATAKNGRVHAEHLPRQFLKRAAARSISASEPRSREPAPLAAESSFPPLESVERQHIEQALTLAAGNKARAARLLGLSRHQLYLRLERLGRGDGPDIE
ncbi:MAG TPA: sigma-54 dependent transcriptional regulator [Polyangiaceae bacterium]|nr:sigma-54 dependent transcriptional regulator [Polyangiaceae bacterium]